MRYYFIFLVVIVFCFYLWHSLVERWNDERQPVDIVYTWVDGSDESLMSVKNFYAGLHGNSIGKANDNDRFEINDELRYSLRSLEKFFPRFRKVFIVAADGQYPSFLVPEHPQLQVVKHSEIIPAQYLPTFNSLVIESFLHKIPDLSERYVYFNDDIMLNRKMNFFDSTGKPELGYVTHSTAIPIDMHNIPPYSFEMLMAWNYKYVESKYGITEKGSHYHGTSPCLKSVEQEMINMSDPAVIKTSESRFRKTDNVAFNSIVRPIVYKNVCKFPVKPLKSVTINGVVMTPEAFLKKLKSALSSSSHIVCVNSVTHGAEKEYKEIMEKALSRPSRFEK
jgi:hypothetical protein